MADTALGGVIQFFQEAGLFDVVLPFILTFTIVFAILEKTKVFGTETIGGEKYTRKNLNATTAFVIAFFVIASSRLVGIITEVSSNSVILLLLIILFLMLVGAFFKEGEPVSLAGGWKWLFMVIMFVGIILIFLNALGWLEATWNTLSGGSGTEGIGAIILIVIIVVFVALIVREPKKGNGEEK